MLGAAAGSAAAKAIDGEKLLSLFGLVMIVVGVLMLRGREVGGDQDVRLSGDTARELLPLLLGIGLGVGLFSGFFGIGGFLIIPGFVLATGNASDLRDRHILGGRCGLRRSDRRDLCDIEPHRLSSGCPLRIGWLAGGVAGVSLGKALATRKQVLNRVFAILVIVVGLYIVSRGGVALAA